MKRCPQCNRGYADETQNFCLDDGTWLVGDESDAAPTAILPGDNSLANAPTQQQLNVTRQTEVQASDGEHVRPKILHKWPVVLTAALLVLLLGGVGAWMYRSAGRDSGATRISLQSAKISRLTASGKVTAAVISPDGKYVAHVV